MNQTTMTEEESQLLWKVGTQYKQDWKKIAKRLQNITGNKRSPNFLMNEYMKLKGETAECNDPFTHDEDLKLVKWTEEYGMNWIKIADMFGNRGAIKLKNRYYCYIKKKNLLDGLKKEVEEKKLSGDEFISFEDSPASIELYNQNFA